MKNLVIIVPSVIGILAVIITISVFIEQELPVIHGERDAFFSLAIINFAMCIFGPLRTTKTGEWLRPCNVALYILSIVAFPLIIIALIYATPPLPIISTYRNAIALISLIIFFKWILFFLHWLVCTNKKNL